MHLLDYVHEEPEWEDPVEQAQAEDPTNTKLSQGKLRYISPQSLTFVLNHYFIISLIVH
jgi:hypothetical protein